MRAAVVAVLAAVAVLGLAGVLRPFPWRVAELSGSPVNRGWGAAPSARAPLRRRVRHARRAPRVRQDEALLRDLPLAADLLRLAVSSGQTVHGAVTLVASEGRGPVAAALARAVRGFERGGRLAEELERLPAEVGEALRPLTTTLVVALSSGAPVAPALASLAAAERRRVRRRTEQRVRRLPVLLLGPLVGLVLPAFMCLTVVPVGVTAARTGLQPPEHPTSTEPPRSPP